MPAFSVDNLISTFDTGVVGFFSEGSRNMAAYVAPAFKTSLIVYLAIWGLGMMRGLIKEPLMDGVLRIVRIALIGSLAINAGAFNDKIASKIYKLPTEIGSVLMGSQTSAGAVIDGALDKADKLTAKIQTKSSGPIDAIGYALLALAVWGFTGAVCAVATALIIIAKGGLGIILAFGPLFIFSLLFEVSKKFFEGWMGQAINFIMTYAIIGAVIGMMFKMWDVTLAGALGAEGSPWSAVTPSLLIGVVALIFLKQASAMASGLAGGVQIGTMGAITAGMNKLRGSAAGVGSGAKDGARGLYGGAKRGTSDAMARRRNESYAYRASAAIGRKVAGDRKNKVSRG